MTSTGKSASIIIIGNEILCGRTADTNSHWIARRLYRMGICVKSIVTIPDVEEEIVRTVQAFAPTHDYVFVAGGIGPTPDDVTRQAIATAFARKLVLHPGAELAIRKRCEGAINEYKLEMARLPEGSQLIPNITLAAPGFRLGNVFVF
nr:competence/damage-inducible protein A [Bacillota bacterium]